MTRSIVIGDIHGCYHTLMRLLEKLRFDPTEDHIYSLGDLVGKGPYSDQVLDFFLTLPHVNVVLGNNDVDWMYHCWVSQSQRPDIIELGEKANRDQWLDFFLKQDFLLDRDFGIMVHASLQPSWTVEIAKDINRRLVSAMREDPKGFLAHTVHPKPKYYEKEDPKSEYYTLTQCRYYDGDQFLSGVGVPEKTEGTPWYEKPLQIDKRIFFGHWAMLRGREISDQIMALDGGAVYGGELIAYVVEDQEKISVGKDKDDG